MGRQPNAVFVDPLNITGQAVEQGEELLFELWVIKGRVRTGTSSSGALAPMVGILRADPLPRLLRRHDSSLAKAPSTKEFLPRTRTERREAQVVLNAAPTFDRVARPDGIHHYSMLW